MKPRSMFFLAALVVLVAVIVFAQPASQPGQPGQQPPSPQPVPTSQFVPPDPAAPSLTLEEKITLTTDDVKRSDILEKANKQLQEAFRPINEHQQATVQTIEKEHPGWRLEQGGQGWRLVKREPEKKTEPAQKK